MPELTVIWNSEGIEPFLDFICRRMVVLRQIDSFKRLVQTSLKDSLSFVYAQLADAQLNVSVDEALKSAQKALDLAKDPKDLMRAHNVMGLAIMYSDVN